MDLVGHCAVAAWSGVHSERDVFGPGIVALMLPNVLHCHDWGYQHLWDLAAFDGALRPVTALMRTHVLADWVVHYGDEQKSLKRKVGWAYRRMGHAHARSKGFFEGARRQDLLRSDATDPGQWTRKQKLDFAHSITEYALDFVLAPSILTSARFADVKDHLSRMADPGVHGRAWLASTAAALGVATDRPRTIVEQSIEGLAHDARTAEGPEAFAVGTTLRKYGFYLDARSARYVRNFIDSISAHLDAVECRDLCAAIAAIIARPGSTGLRHAAFPGEPRGGRPLAREVVVE